MLSIFNKWKWWSTQMPLAKIRSFFLTPATHARTCQYSPRQIPVNIRDDPKFSQNYLDQSYFISRVLLLLYIKALVTNPSRFLPKSFKLNFVSRMPTSLAPIKSQWLWNAINIHIKIIKLTMFYTRSNTRYNIFLS